MPQGEIEVSLKDVLGQKNDVSPKIQQQIDLILTEPDATLNARLADFDKKRQRSKEDLKDPKGWKENIHGPIENAIKNEIVTREIEKMDLNSMPLETLTEKTSELQREQAGSTDWDPILQGKKLLAMQKSLENKKDGHEFRSINDGSSGL